MQEQLEIEIEDEQQQPLYPSPEKADDEARGDRVAIYVAYLGAFLTSTDNSIVTATYEIIASDFNRQAQGIWLLIGYKLGYCISVPLYGALSDVFGCKRGILFATVSNELVWLIVGRIISGVGGAGMTILTSVLITDSVPSSEVALLRSYKRSLNMAGQGFGAPLGSLITETVGWRWAFAGRLPIVVACAWLANRHTRDDIPPRTKGVSKYEDLKHIDYAGIVCLSIAIATLVLAINGGVGSVWRVGFAVVCVATSVLFVWLELAWAKKPLIPLTMVQDVGMFWLAQLFTFGGREGLRANLVPYLTKVHDLDTTLASLYIGFMSLGNSMGGIASGLVMKRYKRYHAMSVVSILISIPLNVLLCFVWSRGTSAWGSLVVIPMGIANGIISSAQFVGMTARSEQGSSTSAIGAYHLFQRLGSIIGTAGASAVVHALFKRSVFGRMDAKSAREIIGQVLKDSKYLWTLPAVTQQVVRSCFNDGYQFVPVLTMLSLLVVTPFIIFTKEQRLN
ncbi:MFS transporter [Aspergillus candidus]|uniref:MFS transporter n=1 Tax=Aspergillus candidus TaxID=41067 RepID=A0A2I2F8F9_ASPCN|nr:MFS transporter [Aspergillus candidus]PLB36926.1 MFS transporter [Aspergillus candidus]